MISLWIVQSEQSHLFKTFEDHGVERHLHCILPNFFIDLFVYDTHFPILYFQRLVAMDVFVEWILNIPNNPTREYCSPLAPAGAV